MILNLFWLFRKYSSLEQEDHGHELIEKAFKQTMTIATLWNWHQLIVRSFQSFDILYQIGQAPFVSRKLHI